MLLENLHLLLRSGGRFRRRRELRPPYPLRAGGALIELAGEGGGAAAAYCEVYVGDCYGLRVLARRVTPATIVDVGANIGCFTAFARVLFPAARILAYEPDPAAFAQLAANLTASRIELRRAAVGRLTGVGRFAPGPDSTLGHLSAEGAIEVDVVGTTDVAAGGPIDLLKLDCEGGEWDILGDETLLARTRHIALEYHLEDGRTLADLRRLLTAGGHHIVHASGKSDRHGHVWSERVAG